MAKLDELREQYRKDPARSAFEDTAYELVDVNGMSPDGQLEALRETAREMGWSPDCEVACRHGSFVIREGETDYALPFLKGEDNQTKIVVPECTPEVAARIEAPAYISTGSKPTTITIQTADTTIDIAPMWERGRDGPIGDALREAIGEAARNAGWPETTTVTTDKDILKETWKIWLSDGRGHVIDMELEPYKDNTLTVGKYDPGNVVVVANPPAPGSPFAALKEKLMSGTHVTGMGPVGVPMATAATFATSAPSFVPTKTRTRKLTAMVEVREFDEPLDDDRKVLLAIRAMLPAAGWPSESRVSVELDHEDDEVYVVRCGDVSATVEVKHKYFRDTCDGTTVTLPSFGSAGV